MTKLDKRMIKIEQSQHRLESRLKKCAKKWNWKRSPKEIAK